MKKIIFLTMAFGFQFPLISSAAEFLTSNYFSCQTDVRPSGKYFFGEVSFYTEEQVASNASGKYRVTFADGSTLYWDEIPPRPDLGVILDASGTLSSGDVNLRSEDSHSIVAHKTAPNVYKGQISIPGWKEKELPATCAWSREPEDQITTCDLGANNFFTDAPAKMRSVEMKTANGKLVQVLARGTSSGGQDREYSLYDTQKDLFQSNQDGISHLFYDDQMAGTGCQSDSLFPLETTLMGISSSFSATTLCQGSHGFGKMSLRVRSTDGRSGNLTLEDQVNGEHRLSLQNCHFERQQK
jgi:hypothetical protein